MPTGPTTKRFAADRQPPGHDLWRVATTNRSAPLPGAYCAGARVARVASDTSAVGKRYPAVTYAVGREKVREYAHAVFETDPLHHDVEHARRAGYADVVAPPMFCAVYSAPALGPALLDPAVGMDFALMVHAAQEFRWGPLVVAGDEITTEVGVRDITERDGKSFFVFGSVSTNQAGDTVCVGTWTNIVRAA